MTVTELIAHLHTLPPEADVWFQCYSDVAELKAQEITLREIFITPDKPGWGSLSNYNHVPKTTQTVVLFPGN